MVINNWHCIEALDKHSGRGLINRQVLRATHGGHTFGFEILTGGAQQRVSYGLVVNGFEKSKETNFILVMPVMIVIDKGAGSSNSLAVAPGKEEGHSAMLEK